MSIKYRKDIDGFRAIAVLLVVLYHIGFNIPGGFIGVDIFFVISGFLITSLIQKEILNNNFSFKNFYLRRIRRILPNLIFIISITLVMAWSLLMPDVFSSFTSSIIYALLGVSNIHFYSKGQEYFSTSTDQIPLLHTWSLGVEEQFYLITPIFLILLFKYTYKTKWFNIILGGIFFIGIAISQYLALKNPSFAYYLLPSRFFELLCGTILAVNYKNLPTIKNVYFSNLIGAIGLSLVLFPAFLLSKSSSFPGINALLVCLGACLIIYLEKTKSIFPKILSTKPLVFIGVISYSLYLWHWSVISIIHITNTTLTDIHKIYLVFILLILSVISWKLIEQPFRHKFKFKFSRTLIIFLIIPAVFAQTVKSQVKKQDDFYKYRFAEDMQTIVKKSQEDPRKRKELCHCNISYNINNPKEKCSIGNKNIKINALMFGDSHANSFAPFMDELLKTSNIRALLMTEDAFTYFKAIPKEQRGNSYVSKKLANKIAKKTEEEILSRKYQYIIMAGSYGSYVRKRTEAKTLEIFEENIKLIKSTGATPVLLKDIFSVKNEIPYCPIYNKLLNMSKDCNKSKKEVFEKAESKIIDKVFKTLQKKYPDIIIIDPKQGMCNDVQCLTSINNITLFTDKSHLTYSGSKLIAKEYLNIKQNPFIKK